MSLPRPEIDAPDVARAAARFAQSALQQPGVVGYDVIDSPLGPLVGAMTDRGLAALHYADARFGGVDATLQRLSDRLSPLLLQAPPRLEVVRRELDEYFAGRRTQFDVPIDWVLTGDFAQRILEATVRVGFGSTATYGDVAREAGKPSAARAAGGALNRNPIPIIVPCHRIVGANGKLVGYGGGIERKVALLELEGATP